MKVNWHGVLAATTTHFRPNGALDLPAAARHLDQIIHQGVHGLVVLHNVSEADALEEDEQRALLKVALDVNNGRVPVLACVTAASTQAACDFAFAAEMLGADGLVLQPALAGCKEARDLVVHVGSVAAACGLPVVLSVGQQAGTLTMSNLGRELAEVETLVAIHVGSEEQQRVAAFFDDVADRYLWFGIFDDLLHGNVSEHVAGIISPLASAFPRAHVDLWDVAAAGHQEERHGRSLQWQTLREWQVPEKLVQVVKLCVSERGWGNESIRPPRLALAVEERQQALQLIRALLEDPLHSTE